MDDLNVIDQFMEAFASYIDSGFGLLGGDVGFLTTILIGIDITLAGLFWALGGEDDVIGKFLKKILYVGVFALILNSFQTLSEIIFRSFAGLGLTAGGSAITADDLLRPGRLAATGFEAAWPLLEQAKELVGPIDFFDNFVEIAVLVIAPLRNFQVADRSGNNGPLTMALLRIWLFGLYLSAFESFFLDRADPIWFTFLIAVFGLHYLARFRTTE